MKKLTKISVKQSSKTKKEWHAKAVAAVIKAMK